MVPQVGRKARALLAKEDSELGCWALSPEPTCLTAMEVKASHLQESRRG